MPGDHHGAHKGEEDSENGNGRHNCERRPRPAWQRPLPPRGSLTMPCHPPRQEPTTRGNIYALFNDPNSSIAVRSAEPRPRLLLQSTPCSPRPPAQRRGPLSRSHPTDARAVRVFASAGAVVRESRSPEACQFCTPCVAHAQLAVRGPWGALMQCLMPCRVSNVINLVILASTFAFVTETVSTYRTPSKADFW